MSQKLEKIKNEDKPSFEKLYHDRERLSEELANKNLLIYALEESLSVAYQTIGNLKEENQYWHDKLSELEQENERLRDES